MFDRYPIEFTSRVLDKRNNLTGPDDSEKANYPKRPKNVNIKKNQNN